MKKCVSLFIALCMMLSVCVLAQAEAGTYTASGDGLNGPVTVEVTVDDDGVITALTIDASGETPGLGQLAMEEDFINQFIGKSAPFAYGEDGIEALTGATITSDAVSRHWKRRSPATLRKRPASWPSPPAPMRPPPKATTAP